MNQMPPSSASEGGVGVLRYGVMLGGLMLLLVFESTLNQANVEFIGHDA